MMVKRLGAIVAKYYRIVFEEYDIKPCCETQDNIILEGEVSAPESCLDFGIRHEAQMELISKAQDKIGFFRISSPIWQWRTKGYQNTIKLPYI